MLGKGIAVGKKKDFYIDEYNKKYYIHHILDGDHQLK